MKYNGPIGGLISFSIGGGWGSEVAKDGYSRVAIIRGTDIPKVAAGEFSTIPYRFESDKKLANRYLAAGDIILETAGGSSANGQYTGRTALITDEVLDALGPTICASFCKRLVLDKDLVNPTYFYYYMQDLYKSGRVASYDSQSTGISNFQFENFINNEVLELPTYPHQIAIGNVLASLQAKMNINSQIASTLEQIAQTIFKSCFVDFDPVHAKARGEQPVGMDADTAALFPDSFEDSEHGPIPSGWHEKSLGDICDLFDSKRVPLAKDVRASRPGPFPYYGATGALDAIDDFIFDGIYVLVAEDGTVMTAEGTPVIQYVWGKFWVSNHAHILKGRDSMSDEQLMLLLQRVKLEQYVTGAVQMKVSQGNLKSIPVVAAPSAINSSFSKLIEPLYAQIRTLKDQNQSLMSIRDSLLPRLISGELEIPAELLDA